MERWKYRLGVPLITLVVGAELSVYAALRLSEAVKSEWLAALIAFGIGAVLVAGAMVQATVIYKKNPDDPEMKAMNATWVGAFFGLLQGTVLLFLFAICMVGHYIFRSAIWTIRIFKKEKGKKKFKTEKI